MNLRIGLLVAVGIVFTACASFAREETVGEQFRKVMAEIDAQCKKDKLGPYLDPADPEYRTKRKQTDCDILKLKPYDPLATPEGRFAHSLKLPPPHDKPKDVYQPGMTGEEYFKALCEAEAGEFVFRTVNNVDSIAQIRRYIGGNPEAIGHLILSEDINGYHLALEKDPEGRLLRSPPFYWSAEIPNSIGAVSPNNEPLQYHRFARRVSSKDKRPALKKGWGILQEVIDEGPIQQPLSKYAFVQRGISRPNDIEHGIRGAELIVVDWQTTEVLGFKRTFARYFFDKKFQGNRNIGATGCPSLSDGFTFVKTILKPISPQDKKD